MTEPHNPVSQRIRKAALGPTPFFGGGEPWMWCGVYVSDAEHLYRWLNFGEWDQTDNCDEFYQASEIDRRTFVLFVAEALETP